MKTVPALLISVISFIASLFLTDFLIRHSFLFLPVNLFSPAYLEIISAFLKDLFTDWIFIIMMLVLGIYAYTKRHSIEDAIDINIIGKSTTGTYIIIGILIVIFAVTGPFGSQFPLFLFSGLFSAIVFPIYCFFLTYFVLRKKVSDTEIQSRNKMSRNYLIFLIYLGFISEFAVSVYLFSCYRSITIKQSVILFLSVLLIFFICFTPHRLSKLHNNNLLFIFSLSLLCLSVQINAFSGILFPKNLSAVISCLMFLFTCSVIYLSMKKDRLIEKTKFEQKTKEISQQQLEVWNKQNDQLLRLKHDFLHKLSEAYKLIQNNQNEEAALLLEQFSTDLLQNNEKIYCNDIYINSLLQSRAESADHLTLNTDIYLNPIPSSLSMDICIILSELIDCQSAVPHTVSIHIIEQAGTIIIQIKWDNTDHTSSFQSDLINDIVHHYHGVMELKDEDTYTVSILLLEN